MTIAASILCADGIVLCADTEETITEERKGSASKIRVIQHATYSDTAPIVNWTIGVAGAGHSDWISVFVQEMSGGFLEKIAKQQTDFIQLRIVLDEYVQRFFTKYIRSYANNPSYRPQAHMLIVVQFVGYSSLREIYRVNDNVVLSVEWNVCVAVGKGAYVFQHLADRLLKPSHTMREAASISAYILDRVKSETPGCGGNSHIVMIGSDGTEHQIPTRRIKELEIHHADVELRLDDSFSAELIKELP